MKNTLRPYIGITDFTNHSQVERMLEVFRRHRGPRQAHRLHVGVMMSYKTLNGLETKWTAAFPAKETIRDIFSTPDQADGFSDDELMYCLHYADYREIDLVKNLSLALKYGGMNINALQLDMVWPNPADVANAVDQSRKNPEVILQVGKDAIEMVDNSPQKVVGRLEEYRGVIHHVLLDRSMGRGLGMDAHSLLPFIVAIKSAFPELGIAVAGGLGPETLELLLPIIKKYNSLDLSIDAQGLLRPSGNALDPIDWNMAELYLIGALQILR